MPGEAERADPGGLSRVGVDAPGGLKSRPEPSRSQPAEKNYTRRCVVVHSESDDTLDDEIKSEEVERERELHSWRCYEAAAN
ncbi:hypothetical protein WA026_016794 [Henosepilachna vigintioctopunctata]|uniref:Uncharacterized protein n=1 Tax=Henosepilachna vigintioctopunctata TaxID=420089 RepID=A0AAW1UZA9_9CUCU